MRGKVRPNRSGEGTVVALGRDFHLYATGRAVSVIGDRVATIALVFLVVHLSQGFSLAVGLFYVCRAMPTVLGGLLAGVIADAFDRRRLMVACDCARAVLLAVVPVVTQSSLGWVFPIVVVLYAFTLAFTAAAGAAIPDVVAEPRLMSANAILQGINNAADVAYAVGGALIFEFGYQAPFYIDAATFVFSAATISLMRIPHHREAVAWNLRELGARIGAGFEFIAGDPFLRWSTVAMVVAPAAGGAGYVLAPIYASSTLGHSAGLVGPLSSGAFRFSLLEVGLGMGALGGSGLAPRLARRWPRGRLFGLGLVGTGAADAALSISTNAFVAIGLMAVSGAFFSVFIVSAITLSQSLTPSEVRGRVIATRGTMINGALLVGSALAAPLLLVVSVRSAWILEGLIIASSSLVVWLRPEVHGQL